MALMVRHQMQDMETFRILLILTLKMLWKLVIKQVGMAAI